MSFSCYLVQTYGTQNPRDSKTCILVARKVIWFGYPVFQLSCHECMTQTVFSPNTPVTLRAKGTNIEMNKSVEMS